MKLRASRACIDVRTVKVPVQLSVVEDPQVHTSVW